MGVGGGGLGGGGRFKVTGVMGQARLVIDTHRVSIAPGSSKSKRQV